MYVQKGVCTDISQQCANDESIRCRQHEPFDFTVVKCQWINRDLLDVLKTGDDLREANSCCVSYPSSSVGTWWLPESRRSPHVTQGSGI